jgi:hypothetical protein
VKKRTSDETNYKKLMKQIIKSWWTKKSETIYEKKNVESVVKSESVRLKRKL